MVHDYDGAEVVDAEGERIGTVERSINNHAKHHVSATTWCGYEINVRVHIVPKLGTVPVQQLAPAHIQRFFSDKIEEGCGPRTLQLSHLHISQALDLAVGN